MNELCKLFSNLDNLAECISKIDLRQYKEFRSMHTSSNDSSEKYAYFCAVPKTDFSTIAKAFPLLFVHSLFYSEEWSKDDLIKLGLNQNEWRNVLRTVWIPQYLSVGEDSRIACKSETKENFFNACLSVADRIFNFAVQSEIQSIIRYGDINAWNYYNYILETETEYVDFQFWTTA